MLGRIVIVVSALVGCGGAAASQPEPAQPVQMRPTIPSNELPKEIQGFVPKHGIYLAGGGAASAVFRVIIDTDAKTIYTGTSPAGTPLHGKLAEERTRELTPANEQRLMKLASDACTERPPATEPEAVASYDEYLVIADNTELFFLHQQGPIQRPLAVKAIAEIRAAAAL
jgi:hypothetical protein